MTSSPESSPPPSSPPQHALLDPTTFSRRVATLCFCTDTFFQALSLLGEAEVSRSSPSSLYAAYAPHPYAQLGFFVVGVMVQLMWVLKLYPVAVATVRAGEEGSALRRSWSGSLSLGRIRRAGGGVRDAAEGEGSALLFSADEEDVDIAKDDNRNDTQPEKRKVDHSALTSESDLELDSRPGTPDDEREERDGQVLPMKPMSPKRSSRLASTPKSDAIPVIEVTDEDDRRSEKSDDEKSERSAMSEKSENRAHSVGSASASDAEEDDEDDVDEQEHRRRRLTRSGRFVVMSERLQLRYVPHYFISTACQVGWTCSWIMLHYDLCIVFVFINLFSQIYALFVTLDGSRNHRFPTSNVFTQLTAKLRIALAVLCLWKTWGAVDVVPPPTFIEGVVNCTFFILLSGASGPDPTMGILLALILFSLGMGRHNNLEWHLMFNWSSVIVFLFVAVDWAGGVQIRQLVWPRSVGGGGESDDGC